MKQNHPLIQGTVTATIFCFLFLFALALGSFLLLRTNIHDQALDIALIKMSAEQQTLSQRAALLGLSLMSTRDRELQDSIRAELNDLIVPMESVRQTLRLHASRRGTSKGASSEVQALIVNPPYELDRKQQQFLNEIKELVALDSVYYTFDNPHINYIAAASTDLLRGFALLTEQYRRENAREIIQQQKLQVFILIVTFISLLAMWIFLFRPTVQKLQNELQLRIYI